MKNPGAQTTEMSYHLRDDSAAPQGQPLGFFAGIVPTRRACKDALFDEG